MKKFSKSKIALFLACTSVLGSKTQAMNTNKAQSSQSTVALGRSISKNEKPNKGFINWVKDHKLPLGIGGGAIVLAAAATATFFGVKHSGKKDEAKDPNGRSDEQSKNIGDAKEEEQSKIDDKSKMNIPVKPKSNIKKPVVQKKMSNVEKNLLNSFISFFQEDNYILSECYKFNKQNNKQEIKNPKNDNILMLKRIIKIMQDAKNGNYKQQIEKIEYNVSFDSKNNIFKITACSNERKVPDFEYEISQDADNKDIWHIFHQRSDGNEVLTYSKKIN